MKAFLYSFSSIVTVSGLLKFIVQEQQHKMSINERMIHIFFMFKPPFLASLYHKAVRILTVSQAILKGSLREGAALYRYLPGCGAVLANEAM